VRLDDICPSARERSPCCRMSRRTTGEGTAIAIAAALEGGAGDEGEEGDAEEDATVKEEETGSALPERAASARDCATAAVSAPLLSAVPAFPFVAEMAAASMFAISSVTSARRTACSATSSLSSACTCSGWEGRACRA